jgi:filamentous hemagglutinin family protein
MHNLRPVPTVSASLLALAIGLASVPALADPLPIGGSVVAGSAAVSTAGNVLTVNQSSSRAVINWQSFDVGAAGKVVFNQPNAGSAALNRVTGSTPSTIAGSISANGSVFLVNPNGITITKSGVVTVARGFVASTLDIADADFLAGRGRFAGTSGEVANAGSIVTGTGGFVGLLGAHVASTGSIVAPAGQVSIGAVTMATLDLNGDNWTPRKTGSA